MYELKMYKILDEVVLKPKAITTVSAINKKKERTKMTLLSR